VIHVVERIRPPYFEKIRSKAADRWDQLEADEELAAPWWQLFRQIQSPHHVLSELLQNADDAGARVADVKITGGTFIFEHDGEDFTEEQFASLCKFGFSNKRFLHTIGFRGIGFKAIFSLGDEVQLITPTLAVRFSRNRFTEPVWMDNVPHTSRTRISVQLRDQKVVAEIQKSFQDWIKSSLSLLFFQNISRLTIDGNTVTRRVVGQGPVSGSKKVRLANNDELEVVHFTSSAEPFPEDALQEIRQERMAIDKDLDLPPCKVEIVTGVPGPQYLYVVLPTDKQINIPFSVNAPFVQDPARMGIKDPSISPTNRWLLERVGNLAAKCMLDWLSKTQLKLSERAEAYQFLPNRRVASDDCEWYVSSCISNGLKRELIILASDGSLVNRCFTPPYFFYEIWEPEEIAIFAGSEYDAILSKEIIPDHRKKLERWGFLTNTDEKTVIDWFETHEVPRPKETHKIVKLWAYILNNRSYWKRDTFRLLKIMPIDGWDVLFPSEQLVRIGDSIRGLSNNDAEFLSDYLLLVDRTFLGEVLNQSKNLDSDTQGVVSDILFKTNLEKDSTAKVILEKAYAQISPNESRDKLIRFAHIAGFLYTDIPKNFLYVTKDGMFRSITDDLALDVRGDFEQLLPESYNLAHLLQERYITSLTPEKREEWIKWAESNKSGLKSFVGIVEVNQEISNKSEILSILKARGGKEPKKYPLQKGTFLFTDYDIHPEFVDHIEQETLNLKEGEKEFIWRRIFELIIADPNLSWKNQLEATFYQRGISVDHKLSCGRIPATWILRLANTKCLMDTEGIARKPHELLLRNARTEAFMGLEPFVKHEYDREELRDFLIMLGVRDTPGSPDAILDRIAAFSGHTDAPEIELMNLYKRLDGLLKHSTPYEISIVRERFSEQRMIFTQEKRWAYPNEVFITLPVEEMAGLYRVLFQIRDLPLWNRIGVEYEPTIDILIQQLQTLKPGTHIDSKDRIRIRTILSRAPHRVWEENGHWLGLDGAWNPTSAFSYYGSSSIVGGADSLFPQVKGITADFRMIDGNEIAGFVSKTRLKDLQSDLSFSVSYFVEADEQRKIAPWMEILGQLLMRVSHKNPEEKEFYRDIGARLSETVWIPVLELEVTPYLNGSPAGKEQRPEVFWDDQELYVQEMPPGRLLKIVPSELKRACSIQAVSDAIIHCYDRDPEIVKEYCEENFTLIPDTEDPSPSSSQVPPLLESPSDPNPGILHIKPNGKTGSDGEKPMSEKPPDTPTPPLKPIKRPGKRKLIDILVEKYQFVRGSSKGHFYHADGSWIRKGESPFQWEMYSSDGDIRGRFWVNEGKLSKGIEIPAEVWRLIQHDPEKTVILLRSDDDGADVIPGNILLTGVEQEELGLFPAKYRLRRITE